MFDQGGFQRIFAPEYPLDLERDNLRLPDGLTIVGRSKKPIDKFTPDGRHDLARNSHSKLPDRSPEP